jgi:hypothetical protein
VCCCSVADDKVQGRERTPPPQWGTSAERSIRLGPEDERGRVEQVTHTPTLRHEDGIPSILLLPADAMVVTCIDGGAEQERRGARSSRSPLRDTRGRGEARQEKQGRSSRSPTRESGWSRGDESRPTSLVGAPAHQNSARVGGRCQILEVRILFILALLLSQQGFSRSENAAVCALGCS